MKFVDRYKFWMILASVSLGCTTSMQQSSGPVVGEPLPIPETETPTSGNPKQVNPVPVPTRKAIDEVGARVCSDWKELGVPVVLKVLTKHRPSPRAKEARGAVSIRLPGSIQPAQYLIDGTLGCELVSEHFGCRVSHETLIEPVTALVPMCGTNVQPQLPRIVAAYQSINLFKLDRDSGLKSLEASMPFCTFPRIGDHGRDEIRKDRVVRRELSYSSSTDGTCSLEIEKVPPQMTTVDGLTHYYVFTRIFRDLHTQQFHAVTVAFITLEKDWPLLAETVEKSARSLEVDWQQYLKRKALLGL